MLTSCRQYTLILFIAFVMTPLFSSSNGQIKQQDRLPAVAGQFYPDNRQDLLHRLADLYGSAISPTQHHRLRALVLPHAGYDFSGGIAADGYNQLVDLSDYQRIFIIASSHRVSIGKASVYSVGDYVTPLGKLQVDSDIVNTLLKQNCFTFDPAVHRQEHSLEVQLPFLQFMDPVPPIVPIVIASQQPSVAEDIAEVLRTWFTPDNLFIISADFSHFPGYADAQHVDKLTAEAFCSGDPQIFMNQLKVNEGMKVRGLSTSMCAWPAGLTLLHLSMSHDQLYYEELSYANSGDHPQYGDKRRVVGYHAIALRDQSTVNQNFYLSNKDKTDLLGIARQTLNDYVVNRKQPNYQPDLFSSRLLSETGAFVSLKINKKLRGCIGSFKPREPLYETIGELTVASSSRDSRFLPVQPADLPDIHIEISVLTPMKRIHDIKEIQLGKHGIYIRKGANSGTFLPQVATETGWSLEEFLGHCSRDKAGIGWEGWRKAEIYTFEAIIFKEKR